MHLEPQNLDKEIPYSKIHILELIELSEFLPEAIY